MYIFRVTENTTIFSVNAKLLVEKTEKGNLKLSLEATPEEEITDFP